MVGQNISINQKVKMMSENTIQLFSDDNLSVAWAQAFLHTMKPGSSGPFVISVTGLSSGQVEEDLRIRHLLDQTLAEQKESSCATVANTIFPVSLWNSEKDRRHLFERYDKTWARISKCPSNRFGVYFRRMTHFENNDNPVNQLEYVIQTWQGGNHRRSALQASILDPRSDLSHSPRRGFPCLQQVSFLPLGANGRDGLVVFGYYPTQYFFQKAYGNYLGLCRLGFFMAQEMGLKLKRMDCMVTVPKHDGGNKTPLRPLEKNIEHILNTL